MSFHSGYAYKVNANQEVVVDCQGSNVTATLDTGDLATSALQTAGNSSLSTISTNISTIAATASGSELQVDVITSALPTGAATESTLSANGSTLSTISSDIGSLATESTASSQLTELQTMDTSLTTIAGAVSGGQVQVDIVAYPAAAGSQANLSNAASTSNGSFSNAISTPNSRCISIFGSTTGTGAITIQTSADGSNYYDFEYSIFPGSNGNFSSTLRNVAVNNVRLKFNETATVTATALHA